MKKKFSIAFFALTLLMGAVSCGDNDDKVTVPGASAEVNPSQVFANALPSEVGDYAISYNSKGQVAKVTDTDGDKTVTFDYTGGSRGEAYDVLMSVEWGEPGEWVKFYITLNDRGFAASAIEECNDPNDGPSIETWSFDYNADGRLVKMFRSEGNNEVTTITYQGGDIVKVDMVSDADAEGDRDEMHAVITNSTIVNTSGIMLWDDTYRIDMDEFAPAMFAGLLGMPTTYLPMKAVEDDGYYHNASWTLDSNNMPTSATISSENDSWEVDFKWNYSITTK